MKIFRHATLFAAAALAVVALGAAACGDDDDDGDDETPATATTAASGDGGGDEVVIEIGDNSFPAETEASVGQVVRWDWSNSSNPHSVVGTSDNATDLLESETFSDGDGEYEVTFDEPGTYEYECGVHGSAMSGSVVVS